jgi:hypothetical protein
MSNLLKIAAVILVVALAALGGNLMTFSFIDAVHDFANHELTTNEFLIEAYKFIGAVTVLTIGVTIVFLALIAENLIEEDEKNEKE